MHIGRYLTYEKKVIDKSSVQQNKFVRREHKCWNKIVLETTMEEYKRTFISIHCLCCHHYIMLLGS